MSYANEVLAAMHTLIDLCAYHEGQCKGCEAQQLCNSKQPKELVDTHISHNTSQD